MPPKIKRILTDIAGYGLIVLGILSGPIPGPGGIPIVLAGLGLLSINNEWARRIRDYLLEHGGNLVKKLFPDTPVVQWLYDALVILLLALVAALAWRYAAIWQISLAICLFFLALLVAGMNRDRATQIKAKLRRKSRRSQS